VLQPLIPAISPLFFRLRQRRYFLKLDLRKYYANLFFFVQSPKGKIGELKIHQRVKLFQDGSKSCDPRNF
jgi:hypothetical protein